jgi:hypothetical protein
MIPEPAMMQKLAIAIEEKMHVLGWDNVPPLLGIVVHVKVGWISAPTPVQPAVLSDDLGDGLQVIVKHMRETRQQGQTLTEAAHMGAAWIAYEGWINEDADPMIDPRRLADIPGTQECRQVLMMDFSGRLTQAMRIRGEQPFVTSTMPQEVPVSMDLEGVLVGLRDLLLEHAVEMPEGEADIVALASWKTSR